MRRVSSLYGTSIGKKFAMAVTAMFLLLYLVLHMWGNLKIFFGPEKFNHYAEWLRVVGDPVFGPRQVLWAFRVLLIISVVVHMVAFAQLWLQSRRARAQRYRHYDPQVFSYASRTMVWGGVAIFLFVTYHIMHFTTGNVHPDFIPGDAYHNVVVGFQSWPITVVYLVALAAVGLHLYHGVWSWFQTMGVAGSRVNRYRRPAALLVALVICLGFAAVPIAVLTGLVR